MSYRRAPVFVAVEPQVVASGLMPDRHNLQAALWERALNVRQYSGKVRRLVPAAELFAAGAAAAARGLSQVQDSTGTRWIWFAKLNTADQTLEVYRWFAGAATLIYTFPALQVQVNQNGAQLATFADLTHYGDWTIINNGKGAPQIHKPDTGIAPFAGPVAQAYLKKLTFVLAIGTGLNRKGFQWPYSKNIEQWVASEANDAGSNVLEDLDTGINAAAPLGQFIAVYAEDQMGLIQYIGQPAIFAGRVVLDGVGACGKMAVASDGRANYGVSRNGVWRTDGQSYSYISEGAVHDYLQANVNWAQASKIIAARNDVTGCFDFHFPLNGSLECNEGWSFDPRTGGWSKIPAMQSQVERKLFDRPLSATSNKVLLLENNPALAGPLDLATKSFVLQTPHTGALVDEAQFMLKSVSNVEVRLGVSEKSDPVTFVDWSSWLTLHADMRTVRIDARVAATFHRLEFRSIADNWDLDLQGFILYGSATQGARRDTA